MNLHKTVHYNLFYNPTLISVHFTQLQYSILLKNIWVLNTKSAIPREATEATANRPHHFIFDYSSCYHSLSESFDLPPEMFVGVDSCSSSSIGLLIKHATTKPLGAVRRTNNVAFIHESWDLCKNDNTSSLFIVCWGALSQLLFGLSRVCGRKV